MQKKSGKPSLLWILQPQPTKHVWVGSSKKKMNLKKKKAYQSCIAFSSCFIPFFLHKVKFPRIISRTFALCLCYSPGLWPRLLRHQRTPLSPYPVQPFLLYLLGSWEPFPELLLLVTLQALHFLPSCPVPKMLVNWGFFFLVGVY